jgi:hypothetical protein
MSAVSLYGINGWKVIQSQKDYAPKPFLFTQRLQRAQRRNLIVLIQHLSSKFTQAWSQWKHSKFTVSNFKALNAATQPQVQIAGSRTSTHICKHGNTHQKFK